MSETSTITQQERDLVLLALYDGEKTSRITQPVSLPERRLAAWDLFEAAMRDPDHNADVTAAASRVYAATEIMLEEALADVQRILAGEFVGLEVNDRLLETGYDQPIDLNRARDAVYDDARGRVLASDDERVLLLLPTGPQIVDREDIEWSTARA